MRLNQNEEDLFNEIDKIEFDFSLSDDIEKLHKKDKEKLLKEINNSEDLQTDLNDNKIDNE